LKISLKRILSLAIALEILGTSIGIAQVSHICRMALANQKEQSCTSSASKATHECCKDFARMATPKKKDCCSTEIRYYHNSILSTLPEFQNVSDFIALHELIFPDSYKFNILSADNFSSYRDYNPPFRKSIDLPIFISIQSFLI